MLIVSVYKGSERQMQVWGMSFTYALFIFFGLVVFAGGYIVTSISYNLGFMGLVGTMVAFGIYAGIIFKVSKKYGRGGFSKAMASVRVPDVIRGGITQPSRLKYLSLCSGQKRKQIS